MTDEEHIRRAEEARLLLSNPLVVAAFQDMEREITRQIVACSLEKPEVERRLVDSLRILDQFKRIFSAHIETGKLAQFNLDRPGFFERIRRKAA